MVINCLHMNHINAVVDGFDDTVAHFREVYGAELISDMPRDEWHACLIAIGGVILELFSPHDDLLHARFGPHYVGVEYQTTDVGAARDAVTARGMRVIRELGVAFHVHPADAFGVALEFFDRSFHDYPPPVPYLEPLKPEAYWRDDHPLGLAGLKRYTVAVSDLDAAVALFGELVGAELRYETDRPTVAARAVGLDLGDTVLELQSPVGDGLLARYLARWGDGIRSVVFEVVDLARAQVHMAAKGIELRPGDDPDTLAIAPDDNRGLLFEFAQ